MLLNGKNLTKARSEKSNLLPENPKEKGHLTFAERAELLKTTPTDPLSRLAVILGLLCGMRMGEVCGLHWGDIDNGRINLIHNFVHMDGLKKPKRGKTRTVPFPTIVETAFEEIRRIAIRPAPDNYVLKVLNAQVSRWVKGFS